MEKKPVITFENFSFQYFSQAEPTLHDINLTIYEGEKVLLVGPSGSGKSTLGHCINGLIPFSYRGEMKGSVKVAGLETREGNLFELSKKVGTVLQDSDGQFIGLTVGEMCIRDRVTVTAPGELSVAQRKRVERCLNRSIGVAPEDIRYRRDASLIGGMTVRIGDQVLDGSVRTRLRRMKEELLTWNGKAGEESR